MPSVMWGLPLGFFYTVSLTLTLTFLCGGSWLAFLLSSSGVGWVGGLLFIALFVAIVFGNGFGDALFSLLFCFFLVFFWLFFCTLFSLFSLFFLLFFFLQFLEVFAKKVQTGKGNG